MSLAKRIFVHKLSVKNIVDVLYQEHC